ncbi:MAG TPA: DUF1338 domain-containing protein [Bdellovibrionales bacterium]|nr:DUF1338 domain-containing protein [Bdellovibrionales bacterium]
MSTQQALDSVFSNLWNDYVAFNPQAKRIYELIFNHEKKADPNVKELINDHVALRTYNVPHIGLEALGQLFTRHGYSKGGEYIFADKKLRAWHFEHPDKTLPKVFISELEIEKLSPLVQETARKAASEIDPSRAKREDFLWSRRPWRASHATYKKLLEESEYAAWMYAFGFRSNHFTISVNGLKSFKGLVDLNTFVKSQGFALNQAGGEVKGTPQQFLEQSSTLAESTKVEFDDGVFEIPACYYEFALRHPMANGQLYQGFVTSSADKIFESTNVKR